MTDRPQQFSDRLLQTAQAKSPRALERIAIAKHRIQSVLDRETVAHQRTLEQKIAEQGPNPQRVDPQLIGLALMDLLEMRRLRLHQHPSTGGKRWHSNLTTPKARINERMQVLAPLYASVSGDGFGNRTGDALEIIVHKCLHSVSMQSPRYSYLGQFDLTQPKNQEGRYQKLQPPRYLAGRTSQKEADFFQFGHEPGVLCIECKNYREWIYPNHKVIRELIIKAADLGAVPVLVARRLHYTTRTN